MGVCHNCSTNCCDGNELDDARTMEKIVQLQKQGIQVNIDDIRDHNLVGGDDVESIQTRKLRRMERYSRFEKYFPFYKMDINGYIFHVNQAVHYDWSEKNDPHFNIKKLEVVSLRSLQRAFEDYKSWRDLNNENSDFVRFLSKFCPEKCELDDSVREHHFFSIHKLKMLGILHCQGGYSEKIKELLHAVS